MPEGFGPAQGSGRIGGDRLVIARAAISRLRSEDQALAMLDRLSQRGIEDRFLLGGMLATFKAKRWFGGFASFVQLVERRLGLKKSTAYAAITFHEVLTKHAIPWERVGRIGLTKLSLLCARVAAGKLTAEEFSKFLERACIMTFCELAACFARPRRPLYLLKSRPERTKEDVLLWMRVNGAEAVLAWFREAFPTWRPQDVIAAIWRATRIAPEAPIDPLSRHQDANSL